VRGPTGDWNAGAGWPDILVAATTAAPALQGASTVLVSW